MNRDEYRTKTAKKIVLVYMLFWIITFLSVAYGQESADTICVSRKEMLHYASNSISLKTCETNYELLLQDQKTCKTTLKESQIVLEKQNTQIKLNAQLSEEIYKDLHKVQKQKKRWKNISFALIGTLFLSITLQYI
jgi:hypothetical protein